MPDHVLVTGGLGFVGSAVVAHLLGRGARVTVLDDGSRGTARNVDADRVTIVHGDVRDGAAVSRCLAAHRPDAVVHLAAMHFIPDCNRDPAGCLLTNVVGTENVLAACAEHGVGTVVAASSMAVYPISDGPVVESDPVGPYDVYGETKAANELQLGRWCRGGDGRVAVALRLANAYGPRETNPHVIPAVVEQVRDGATELDLGATTPMRDYVHTSDIAAAVDAVLRASLGSGPHVFNVGSGTERSVDDILGEIGDLVGRPVSARTNPAKLRPVERMHLLPDVGAIARATGWRPRVAFRDGMRDLLRWYGVPLAARAGAGEGAR